MSSIKFKSRKLSSAGIDYNLVKPFKRIDFMQIFEQSGLLSAE